MGFIVSFNISTPVSASASFPLMYIGATCLPAIAENSDESFSLEIASGETAVLADVSISDDTGIIGTAPAAVNIVIPGEVIEKSGIQYHRPPLEQITSYMDYDEGYWMQDSTFVAWYNSVPANPLYCQQLDSSNPSLLLYNNIHGTKIRFTDVLGGQTYSNGVVQCHLTGTYIFNSTVNGTTNLVNHLAAINTNSTGSITNWMGFTRRYFEIWLNQGSSGLHAPFSSISIANTMYTITRNTENIGKVWTLFSLKRMLDYDPAFSTLCMMMAPGDF